MEKYKIGTSEGSFIHRLAQEIDNIIEKGIIEYDFCGICFLEISGDVGVKTFKGQRFHKYCFVLQNEEEVEA